MIEKIKITVDNKEYLINAELVEKNSSLLKTKYGEPFLAKEGDILVIEGTSAWICIYKTTTIEGYTHDYASMNLNGLNSNSFSYDSILINNRNIRSIRLATEVEKRILFKAIEKDGRKWNAEEKKIETLSLFKDGDIVFEDGRVMIVKSLPNKYHVNLNIASGDFYFNCSYGLDFSGPIFRYATDAEKQKLFDTLAKDGKRWNPEKKYLMN